MLTDQQMGILIKYYQTIHLTGEQKDRLIKKYWEANGEDRKEIARAYAHLFAQDAGFVQRLMFYHDHYISHCSGGRAGGAASPSAWDPAPSGSSDGGSPTPSSPFSGSNGGFAPPRRLTHTQRLVRTAIQDQFPRLPGPGPYALRFALVQSAAERQAVVELYASQFEYPDPQELRRLVTLPQSLSTRTRRRVHGSYTWYLHCDTTNEVVCAVTVTVHHHQTHRFVEMPLFATAAGYKRNGFGRLLNAALAAWCQRKEFEFVMISADVQAIPFWRHLGYEMMSKRERNGIAFFYEHECYKFKGAEAMIGYCRPSHAAASAASSTSLAADAKTEAGREDSKKTPVTLLYNQRPEIVLQGMPKFVVVGPLDLP
ncbi:unnamed protein product [Phytomonas sp. EM1]|nr:unnamed protein product [Phytomonas sp. EM1]|eukprot:CCW60072.1 unnamed protein product [Phytomonas sp. isolate EM1]